MRLVELFNELKRIYGICPCCGEPFRLSEAALFTKAAPPKTVFETIDDAHSRLERQIQKFADREEEIREEARRLGQREAHRRLREIAPFFVARRIDPQDVKLLFHPVEYVVFRGMQDGRCASVDFIDHPPADRDGARIQRSIDSAIRAGNLEWRTFRIREDGRVVEDGAGVRRFSFDA
jgi:predicted Holliday junction resolvase-like endonuclease